jgi:MFS family permease
MPENTHSKYRWYVLSLATFIFLFVFGMGAGCMPVLFSEIAAELNLGLVQLGAVWGSTFLAGIVMLLFGGVLSDKFGVRRTLTIACFAAGIFGSLRGLSDSFTGLIITSLLFGISIETIPTVVLKATSLWFYGRSMGMVQGIVCGGMGVGFMLGAMVSATVMSPLLGGWRNVLFAYGAFSAFLGVVWFLTIREPKRMESFEFVAAAPLWHAVTQLARNRNIWLLALTSLGFAACQQGINGYLPMFLRNSGWTPAAADGALATINATSAITVIPLLMLSDKIGLRKVILLPGLIVICISTALFSIVTGPAVWPVAVMAGIFRNVGWAMIATMIIETKGVGAKYTGTGGGLVLSLSRVGFVLGPPLGNCFASINTGLPFIFWTAACAFATLCFFFVAETGYKSQQTYAAEH